jgi:hypothetical protein
MLGNSISFFYQNNGEMEKFSEVCRFLCSKLNIRRLAESAHLYSQEISSRDSGRFVEVTLVVFKKKKRGGKCIFLN